VHCIDRDPDIAARVREIGGGTLVPHELDLTDFGATERLAAELRTRHPNGVAAVAALAGGFAMSGPIAESDPAVFARQIAINLTTAYSTARAFASLVRIARGAFVFVTSAAVLPGGRPAGMSAYAMAKGGLVQLVRALAQEEATHGVRVNALAPVAIRTAANVQSMGDGVRYVEREELAASVVALASPALARLTGQVLELA
jgi:NAD(P)-dependent dehydrogenase (short-subunit alcohol dehydrogenase family)